MLIIGAGGHAKEVLDILVHGIDKSLIVFFDNTKNAPDKIHSFYNVIHGIESVKSHFVMDKQFSLGLGMPTLRKKMMEEMTALGGKVINITSLTATISHYSEVEGDVMHHAFIGSNVSVGLGSLVNTGVQIHHDVEVGRFVELSPGVLILGKAVIGDFCEIGANATVLPNIRIGHNSVIGAGAVVTKDVPPNSLAVGLPAKVIRNI